MYGKMRQWGAAAIVGSLLLGAPGQAAWAAQTSAAIPNGTAATDDASAGSAAMTGAAQSAYRIVVLGDSVSVGYEPGVEKASDIYGYADRLLEQALLHGRAEESNYAILGLTTEGLNNYLQGAIDGKPLSGADLQDFSTYADPRIAAEAEKAAARTAELGAALAESNIVVLTIGGNDFLDYIRALTDLDTKSAIERIDQTIDNKLNNYTDELAGAIRSIHQLAPAASILLTDQYLPLPERYDADLYARLVQVVDDLADRLDKLQPELADDGTDVGIVHIRDLFLGKELSYTHIFDQDVHPNQAGYAAIAQRFSEALFGGYTVFPTAKRGTAANPLAPALYIDGEPLETANKPVLKNSTTFLALSDIAAATGASLSWDNKTRTATFRKNGNEVAITIGAKTMKVNGTAKALATPAYLQTVGKLQKTYVPLAAVTTGLQYQVVYRSRLNAAFIHS